MRFWQKMCLLLKDTCNGSKILTMEHNRYYFIKYIKIFRGLRLYMPENKDISNIEYNYGYNHPLVEIVMGCVNEHEPSSPVITSLRTVSPSKASPSKIVNDTNIPERYECNSCGRSYKHQFHLRAHLRECSNEPLFQCLKCLKKFYHSRNLARHMVNVHKEPVIKKKENILCKTAIVNNEVANQVNVG